MVILVSYCPPCTPSSSMAARCTVPSMRKEPLEVPRGSISSDSASIISLKLTPAIAVERVAHRHPLYALYICSFLICPCRMLTMRGRRVPALLCRRNLACAGHLPRQRPSLSNPCCHKCGRPVRPRLPTQVSVHTQRMLAHPTAAPTPLLPKGCMAMNAAVRMRERFKSRSSLRLGGRGGLGSCGAITRMQRRGHKPRRPLPSLY